MWHNQKSTAIGFFCLLLVCVMLIGCKNQSAEPTEAPEPTETPTYRVDLSGQEDIFVDVKDRYAAGERVVLKTYVVMDASPIVTVDGERLSPDLSNEDYRYIVYSFTMPDHDVKVDYSLGGSDMERIGCRIEYEGDAMRVLDPVYDAYPGETVMLKMGLIFDVSTDVFVDGESVLQVDGPDSDYLYFAFTMPDHDVVVTVESKNISANE